jgi:hypothetical protein
MKKLLAILSFALFLQAAALPTFAAIPTVINSPFSHRFEFNMFTNAILLRQRNEVRINFAMLKDVSKIDYTLTYTANGLPQGVVGSITPDGSMHVSKTIFLGTCSQNSCVYHNASNIQLEVTTEYKSGRIVTKTLNIH